MTQVANIQHDIDNNSIYINALNDKKYPVVINEEELKEKAYGKLRSDKAFILINLKLYFPLATQKRLSQLSGLTVELVSYYHKNAIFMDLFNALYKRLYKSRDYQILHHIDKAALDNEAKAADRRLAAETHGLIKNETSVKIDLSVRKELEANVEIGCKQIVNLIETMARTGQRTPMALAIAEQSGDNQDCIAVDYGQPAYNVIDDSVPICPTDNSVPICPTEETVQIGTLSTVPKCTTNNAETTTKQQPNKRKKLKRGPKPIKQLTKKQMRMIARKDNLL